MNSGTRSPASVAHSVSSPLESRREVVAKSVKGHCLNAECFSKIANVVLQITGLSST